MHSQIHSRLEGARQVGIAEPRGDAVKAITWSDGAPEKIFAECIGRGVPAVNWTKEGARASLDVVSSEIESACCLPLDARVSETRGSFPASRQAMHRELHWSHWGELYIFLGAA